MNMNITAERIHEFRHRDVKTAREVHHLGIRFIPRLKFPECLRMLSSPHVELVSWLDLKTADKSVNGLVLLAKTLTCSTAHSVISVRRTFPRNVIP
jgi:hypothetical protein